MRVFLGPPRASSLREDGREITALLGANEFGLKHNAEGSGRSFVAFEGPSRDYLSTAWRDLVPADKPFGLLIMFGGTMALYLEHVTATMAFVEHDKCYFGFERCVPAPFLPTQLL